VLLLLLLLLLLCSTYDVFLVHGLGSTEHDYHTDSAT
jgi:hypothetical protein